MCDVLEDAYIRRASSPEAAAIRAVPLHDPLSDQRAIEVLEAHFGESRWDPRMRLRLADVLVRAGKEHGRGARSWSASPTTSPARAIPEKAISILKKIEQLQRRHIEEVSLAPAAPRGAVEDVADAAAPVPAAGAGRGARRRAPTTSSTPGCSTPCAHAVDARARGGPGRAAAAAAPRLRPRLPRQPAVRGLRRGRAPGRDPGPAPADLRPGDVIVTEGEPGQSVFILASGDGEGLRPRRPRGTTSPVSTLGEGSFFGEMSTLSGQPRSATVTAASPCDLLELDRAALDRIAVAHPHVRAVLEEFSRRRAADPAAAAARTGAPTEQV